MYEKLGGKKYQMLKSTLFLKTHPGHSNTLVGLLIILLVRPGLPMASQWEFTKPPEPIESMVFIKITKPTQIIQGQQITGAKWKYFL